jgi:hypothetical protein
MHFMTKYKSRGRPPKKEKKGEPLFDPAPIFNDPPSPEEVQKLFSGSNQTAEFKATAAAKELGQPITKQEKVVAGFGVGGQNTMTIKKRLSKFWRMSRVQLQMMVQDTSTPMGDLALAAILVKAASEGCPIKLNFILDRMVGKVKIAHEKIEEDEMLQKIPTEKLIALIEGLPDTIDAKAVKVDL